MDFLGWWAFHGRQDEISDEVKMWGKILLVPKSEKKVAENLNLNVLICVLISLQKITHLLCDPLCKWSYACGTTSKKLRLPREKSSQWHLLCFLHCWTRGGGAGGSARLVVTLKTEALSLHSCSVSIPSAILSGLGRADTFNLFTSSSSSSSKISSSAWCWGSSFLWMV